MKTEKTKKLEDVAIGWLYQKGCSVYAKEVPTRNGIADALGVRTRDDKHTVYYLEVKSSRSDLICEKQKKIYKHSTDAIAIFGQGIKQNDTGIDFYYIVVADGVKIEDSLYPKWGVIDESGKVIRKAHRMFRVGNTWDTIISIGHVLVYKVYGKLYLA